MPKHLSDFLAVRHEDQMTLPEFVVWETNVTKMEGDLRCPFATCTVLSIQKMYNSHFFSRKD